MKALITGASSGLGMQMAYLLAGKGYDLILVARRKEKLEEIKENLNVDVQVMALDLSSTFNCMKLYNKVKKQNTVAYEGSSLRSDEGKGACHSDAGQVRR